MPMSDSIVADGTPLGKMRGAGDAAGGAGFDAAASASRRFGAQKMSNAKGIPITEKNSNQTRDSRDLGGGLSVVDSPQRPHPIGSVHQQLP